MAETPYTETAIDPNLAGQFRSPIDGPSIDASGTDDEKDLQLVKKLLEKGKKARKPVDKDWAKYDAYYNGNQWIGRKRPALRAMPNVNLIRPAIQTILPIMTDTQPGIDVIPTDPTDSQFSKIISKTIRAWWQKSGMQLTLVEGLMDALKKGTAIFKCVWDTNLENGAGDVHVVVIDPENFYVPDGAIDIDNRCPWTVELFPDTVGALKAKYPDKADKIHATGKKRADTDASKEDTTVIVVSPTDRDTGWTENNAAVIGDASADSDNVWVAEVWIDDYAMEEVEQFDEKTGEFSKVERRKYPNGKVIQCIPDLNLHLKTFENPYEDGGKPYARLVPTLVERRFHGVGEIEPYIETQDMINKTFATIFDYMNMMTNPVWVVDNDSGVDPDMITNQIGAIILKNRGAVVSRESAPPLPAQVYETFGTLRELFDTQTGVHDVTQGRKPVGITAAEAINSMQEAAQTRIRLKERNMQVMLMKLGKLIISRILQFYTKPRIVKITGEDGYPEYIEWYVERDETGGYRYNMKDYKRDEATQTYTPGTMQQGQDGSKGMFDIEIMAGTSLPFLKAQRGELAMKLVGMGLIDQQAALSALDWPEKEQIMKRMQEQQAAQAQAAAGQQSPPPPPAQ